MSIADKLLTIANNTPEVCNILAPPKTVNGSVISIGDVSLIEHGLKIKLISDTIEDFSGVSVSRCGKNLYYVNSYILNKQFNSYYTYKRLTTSNAADILSLFDSIQGNTFVISYKVDNDMFVGNEVGVYFTDNTAIWIRNDVGKIMPIGKTISYIEFRARSDSAEANGITPIIYDIQLELGDTTTEYEPYNGQTATANAEGIVDGLTSVSPNMTLISNNAGVVIDCTYRSSDSPEANEKYTELQDAFANAKTNFQNYF